MSTVSSLHAYGLHCSRNVMLWLIARVGSSTVITRAHTRQDGPMLSSRNLSEEKSLTRRFLQLLHLHITVFLAACKITFPGKHCKMSRTCDEQWPSSLPSFSGGSTTGWQVAEYCGVWWRLFFWLTVVFQVRYRVFPHGAKYDITYGITRYIDSYVLKI